MKIDAVGVATSNMEKTVEFYTLLGFKFSNYKPEDPHVEPETPDGSARLMIDTKELLQEIYGTEPNPSNHSNIAILYDNAEEIDGIVENIRAAGFTIVKEPWDAFWGQHYAVVEDPDGYRIDLFCRL